MDMDKKLLLKDLCARLPYGVKVLYEGWDEKIEDYIDVVDTLYSVNLDGWVNVSKTDSEINIEGVKPYLFPMSSMTEEKVYEFYYRFVADDISFDDFVADYWNTNSLHKVMTTIDDVESIMDWYNKNHLDCRGLIPKGLAEDATGLNIY